MFVGTYYVSLTFQPHFAKRGFGNQMIFNLILRSVTQKKRG